MLEVVNTVDVALESLNLPECERFDYIQRQMVLLIGWPVHRDEAYAALQNAQRIARRGGH